MEDLSTRWCHALHASANACTTYWAPDNFLSHDGISNDNFTSDRIPHDLSHDGVSNDSSPHDRAASSGFLQLRGW
jgi:hypothetical protein